MPLPWVLANEALPEPSQALCEPNGLLCAGLDLSVARLIEAYQKGIFPWYSEGQPVLWWSPDPRMVLYCDAFRFHRSLQKRVRAFHADPSWSLQISRDFVGVMKACAAPRSAQSGTWITPAMISAYSGLQRLGYAQSIELRHGDELMAGLYGVCIGRMFFGESMFTRVKDGSKIALAALIKLLVNEHFTMIDCQQQTEHLALMGARPIPRQHYLEQIKDLCQRSPPDWSTRSLDWP
ncbi:MAG: leucyl/phenylalanyl-tRNA--protein transferase [Proteobacteria bacterium]|nr:leucyl/phenylalanyl-tRNA--protein transferase [Pseudomonadota bacterium]